MLSQFSQHLNHQFPFLKNSKILVTISGGVDSVVLGNLLHQLNYNIAFAHCNFQLRAEESNEDQKFVTDLANEYQLPFFTINFNTKKYCTEHKVSTQIGARTLRYEWFQKIAIEHQYDYIVTAHHLNDSIETFLINLSRGTGIDGLAGIPEINQNIIRPLLPFTRSQIEQFALNNQLIWREDSSNAESKYLRNYIRHQITPHLKKLNPNFEENFFKSLHFITQSKNRLANLNQKTKSIILKENNGLILISKKDLWNLKTIEHYEILKTFGFNNPTEIKKIFTAQTGKIFKSKTHDLLVNRNELQIQFINNTITPAISIHHLNELGNYFLIPKNTKQVEINQKTIVAIDIDSLILPLTIRTKEEGDKFLPYGFYGKKKISKYFKDLKLSQFEKEKTRLLVNGNGEIIWVIGNRLDSRYVAKNELNQIILIKK